MTDIENPKNCAEYQLILKPILKKQAAQAACKNSKRRARLAQETISAVENLFRYTVTREKAAADLKLEAGRLRAQVHALQVVLKPKSHVIVAHAPQQPEPVQGEDKGGDDHESQ
jgi:hypothetical protein